MLAEPGSLDQLLSWLEYFQLEPFGEERDDLRSGSIAAAIYNVNARRGAKQLTPQDCALKFVPKEVENKKPLSPEEAALQARERFDSFKAMMKEGRKPVA